MGHITSNHIFYHFCFCVLMSELQLTDKEMKMKIQMMFSRFNIDKNFEYLLSFQLSDTVFSKTIKFTLSYSFFYENVKLY